MAEERSWADPGTAGAPAPPQAANRRPGKWRTRGRIGWAFWLCIAVVFPASKLMFGIRYRHGERLPTSGPVLLVANHVSILDPIACARLVFDHGRMPHFLAKEAVFTGPAGAILRSAGQARAAATVSASSASTSASWACAGRSARSVSGRSRVLATASRLAGTTTDQAGTATM